jgi:membrane protein
MVAHSPSPTRTPQGSPDDDLSLHDRRSAHPVLRPGSRSVASQSLGVWAIFKHVGAGFLEDRVMTEAAGVTFYVLLSLFPAIASFISIYGLFNDTSTLAAQVDNLNGIMPGGGVDIIKDQVVALTAKGHQALGFAAIISLAISLWSANSGIKSLFDALNVVYHEVEKRSFVRRTLVSFAFTLGGLAFLIFALLAVVAVPIVMNFIGFGNATALLLAVSRWPLLLVVIALNLSLIYRYGPSREGVRWQLFNWGVAGAALGWLLVSLIFSYYVANFGSYNKTYGSLGAVVGFMTWIWISTMVVLLGAELNAELEREQ